MKLIFIRHTAVDVPNGTCYGRTDVPLAATFPVEAAKVRDALTAFNFDAVYSSPSSRCTKLASFCGFDEPQTDPRLMEMDFGEWEMKRFDEIDDPRLQSWYDDFLNVPATVGESSMQQRKRFTDFIADLRKRSHSDTVAIFTHGGIIIHALSVLKGLSDSEAFASQPSYGEIVEIEIPSRPHLKPVMLAGTGSDVGKSLIATGLCRIFRQDGYSPAPFKAQNMALNSYATPDGFEIGRAQAVQAEAAGLPCSTDMNPILLKPSGHHTSQVVVNGKPVGNRDAYEYFRKEGRGELREVVHSAFDRLSAHHNPIVMEGAGSISEINLRDSDLVNMPMARYADAEVILVADIDRGGVFASVYGSIMLQTPEDRRRIKGIIVNKFRGDLRLFDDGRRMMEEICGVPVLGVVPFAPDIHIEEEDSVALDKKSTNTSSGKVNVAVILLRHISNFTDFNVLERNPAVNLFYTNNPKDISAADIIIIPGSKSTLSDLYYLRRSGLAAEIINARRHGGKTVIGICGGYQMMGIDVCDPDNVEGEISRLPGLGLLPVHTTLADEKITRQSRFRFLDGDEICTGYEIHNGRSDMDASAHSLNTILPGNIPEGCMVDEKCFGTYMHGILDNNAVIDHILKPYITDKASEHFDYTAYKESQYDALADHLRRHIDIERLYNIMKRP